MEDEGSFGRWLRKRRKACDLTQAELARRVGCVEGTIRKFEADELRASRQTAARLAAHLGLPPEQHAGFVAFARGDSNAAQRLPTPTSILWPPASVAPTFPESPWHNLPIEPTALIGREQEIAAISALLHHPDVRLVTLTGPGGIGKTRLAFQVAADLLNLFLDGVYFVSLAPVRDPALVASTIAQTLGVRETGEQILPASLKAYLHGKQLLLLLDNFEHVLEAASLVADLLATCPRIAILTTSRTLLRLRGEQQFAVLPLALPPPIKATANIRSTEVGGAGSRVVFEAPMSSAPWVADLSQYAAVRLFIERARSVQPDFALTPESGPAVAAICQRLDGLPLAIELAAAWSKLFGPVVLLAHLADPLALLTSGTRDSPPRQQTLRATIDWSYGLLSEDEQALFARLSIFVDGCTLEAVDAVCNADSDLSFTSVAGVASLLDKNMLRSATGPDDEPRISMLETIRDYAQERLTVRGEMAMLQQRHAAYYLALAALAEPHLRGPNQLMWVERLDAEHNNLRAALRQFVVDGATEAGLRLGGALWRFWAMQGHVQEGRAWLAELLSLPNAAYRMECTAQARGHFAAGMLAYVAGDFDSMEAHFEDSATLSRATRDRWGLACTLSFRMLLTTYTIDRAMDSWCEQSTALFHELEDPWGSALALLCSTRLAIHTGDTKARALVAEGSRRLLQLGDRWTLAFALLEVAFVSLSLHDGVWTAQLYDESLQLFQAMGDRVGYAIALDSRASAARFQEDNIYAAALYDEALKRFAELGLAPDLARALHGRGMVAFHQGDHQRAKALFEQSLILFQELGQRYAIGWCLEGLAGVAMLIESGVEGARRAARLLAADEVLNDPVGTYPPGARREWEAIATAAQAQLDEETFKVAWAEGRTLTLDQAVAEALGTTNLVRDHYLEGQ